MINWFWTAQVVTAIFGLWLFTVYLATTLPILQGKRIVLLIAHPDDEAMFFAPTLQSLTDPALQNQVLIICFSSGNADGLGHIRKEELKKSALQLGITSSEHIVIIEDDRFPDSMTAEWDAKLIGSTLLRYFAPKLAKTPPDSAPISYVDAIITFDSRGVSGHPNHTALYHGAIAYLKLLMQRHTGWECPTKLYTLPSTNIVRKYSSIIDSATTIFTCTWRTKDKGHFPTPIVMVNGPQRIWRAQQAMTTAHKSQMRWFRWGWIGLSRYMIVNDLTRESGVTQDRTTWLREQAREARNAAAKAMSR